ncbi:526_t:CDS:2, partial [Racocetra persica]
NVIGGIASDLKSKILNVISRKSNGLRKNCKTSSKNGSSALSSVVNGGNNGTFNAYLFDIPLHSDSFVPSEFPMARSLSDKPHVLVRSELTLKKLQKKNSCAPDIPSPLGPNRQKEWIKSIDYFPSERHSKRIKSKPKLSMSDKMIESTAAYRVGKKCRGWQNGDAEEYAIKRLQGKPNETIEFVSFSDDGIEYIQVKDINVRLDQERPNLIRKERGYFCSNPNNSPAAVLKCARQYLCILLTIKKKMNL